MGAARSLLLNRRPTKHIRAGAIDVRSVHSIAQVPTENEALGLPFTEIVNAVCHASRSSGLGVGVNRGYRFSVDNERANGEPRAHGRKDQAQRHGDDGDTENSARGAGA
jgi:hypothetical protein